MEDEQGNDIIPVGTEFRIDVPPKSVISFDFDGTLTKWNKKGPNNWYEVPFIEIIRRLKKWTQMGHRCIITTHRTKSLEGNPAFLGHGRDKMKILDLVKDDVLPVDAGGIIYTHMGDKGEVLANLQQRGLNVVMHYDDEMKNLSSVARVGIIGVKVDPGPAPPKYHVAGDGQTPSSVQTPVMAH